MQDAAQFFRQTVLVAFCRRPHRPVRSPDWRCEVERARRFLRYYREELQNRTPYEGGEFLAEIARRDWSFMPWGRMCGRKGRTNEALPA